MLRDDPEVRLLFVDMLGVIDAFDPPRASAFYRRYHEMFRQPERDEERASWPVDRALHVTEVEPT